MNAIRKWWGRVREALWLEPPRCGVCGERTIAEKTFWASHLDAWVDIDCIPAIVRRGGAESISRWLRVGLI